MNGWMGSGMLEVFLQSSFRAVFEQFRNLGIDTEAVLEQWSEAVSGAVLHQFVHVVNYPYWDIYGTRNARGGGIPLPFRAKSCAPTTRRRPPSS